MLIFSDLHLKESSEDICFRVLDEIKRLSIEDDRRVVCVGDFWTVRYRLDVRLLNRVANMLDHWAACSISLDLIPGNHDLVDVAGENALEVFDHFPDVTVWTEPGVKADEGLGFVPYRKDPIEQLKVLQAVAEEKPFVIFAHFGIRGAVMNNGRQDGEGIPLTQSAIRWPHLVLGHYHRPQTGDGWQYVGSPYQTSFGEAGNDSQVLFLNNGVFRPREIDVGAPRHYILEWDPAKDEEPPPRPQQENAKVRLDIKASQEMLVSGKFKSALKARGLEDVQVNVVPVPVERELKMELGKGETLLDAAGRFAEERLEGQSTEEPMRALRRWADGTS